MDQNLRAAYDEAVTWILSQTPDWLDPYLSWIAAAILAVAVIAFVVGPVIGLIKTIVQWLQGRERYRIWKWYAVRLKSGVMTPAQAKKHFAEEVAREPEEYKLAIYADLWAQWESQPNNAVELVLPPAEPRDEEASNTRKAFLEAAQSRDRKVQEALGAVIQERYEDAARLLKEAAEATPGEVARRLRGFATLVQKRHPRLALQMYEEAARADPAHAGSRKALGEAYRTASKGSAGRTDLLRKAAVEFKAAADLAHDANPALEAEALTDCGRCLRVIGEDDDTALRYLNEGLRLKENLKRGARPGINHHEIGIILARRGDLRGALKHQRIAADLDRKVGRAPGDLLLSRSALGVLHRRLGNLAEARSIHQEILAIYRPGDPRRAGELNNLGIVYRLEGRFADARRCHEEALQVEAAAQQSERREVADNCLGDLALAENDPDRAEAIFTRTRAAATKPAVARAIDDKQGVVARLRGQFDKAITIHRQSLASGQHASPVVQLNLAWALLGRGDAEARTMVASARRSFEQSGQKLEIAECRIAQGQIQMGQSDYQGAARHFKEAAAIFREAGARKAAADVYAQFERATEKSARSRNGKRAPRTPAAKAAGAPPRAKPRRRFRRRQGKEIGTQTPASTATSVLPGAGS